VAPEAPTFRPDDWTLGGIEIQLEADGGDRLTLKVAAEGQLFLTLMLPLALESGGSETLVPDCLLGPLAGALLLFAAGAGVLAGGVLLF
jgi:hypothetical protein